jgi:hypothetical protein
MMMPLKYFVKLYRNQGISIYHTMLLKFSKYFRPIKLVVAKCWDPTPRGYFTLPRHEQARPVDPLSWLAHTQAVQSTYNNPQHQLLLHQPANHRQTILNSTGNMSSTISSTSNTIADNERKNFNYFVYSGICFCM